MLRKFFEEMRKTFIFHAVASHFVNGLVPVAVLFTLLTLIASDAYFEHTVIHLLSVTLITIPFSLASGIRDWRVRFHGGRAPIFYRKIKLSIILAMLCGAVVAMRLAWRDPFAAGGVVPWVYGGCIFMMLPVVLLLGHFGGKLAYAVRQKAGADEV